VSLNSCKENIFYLETRSLLIKNCSVNHQFCDHKNGERVVAFSPTKWILKFWWLVHKFYDKYPALLIQVLSVIKTRMTERSQWKHMKLLLRTLCETGASSVWKSEGRNNISPAPGMMRMLVWKHLLRGSLSQRQPVSSHVLIHLHTNSWTRPGSVPEPRTDFGVK
jgi:hypothetical protein